MKDRFYLACTRDNVGTSMAFHAIKGNGYKTDISLAKTFTREEAQTAWEGGREFDRPISADHVDAEAVWKVDCQYIASETLIDQKVDQWCGYKTGRWDGNDVYWLTEGEATTDFSQAKTFSLAEVEASISEHIVFIPRSEAEANKRKTFSTHKFNARTMVQGAGLVLPDHEKRRRRRVDSGKVRWNCPSCGKINWQYNPYDFDGCSDRMCDKWVDYCYE